MSKLTLVATALALAAGALGGAAYQKAALVQTEVRGLHASRSAPAEGPSVETLERDVGRLATRVAVLELRARSAAMPSVEATAAAPPDDEATPTDKRSRSPYDVGPIPKDDAQRAARKQMVSNAVAGHWKAWGAKHGLTERQTADLSSLQADAAKRRLDNQAQLSDHELTQPETRAANQAVAEDVRGKAKAILTAEQFAQFETDKGAEWGSSYRKVREAEAQEAAAGHN
jgi:hypothetical protein